MILLEILGFFSSFLIPLLKAKPVERNWEDTAPLSNFLLGKMEGQEKDTGLQLQANAETGVPVWGEKEHPIMQPNLKKKNKLIKS